MWSWWDCMHWWSTAWNSGADGSMPWPMFLPMLWPVVMIGGLITLVVLLVRSGRSETQRRYDPSRQTPFEILRERFARGEINRQEYEERKGLLSQR